MAPSNPTISVVIVAEKMWVLLLPYTLNSIARQQFPTESIEVIVVTTGESEEKVQAICQRFPHIHTTVLCDEITGIHDPSARKRLGLRHAQGVIIVGMDADIILPAYAFTYISEIITHYPQSIVFADERIAITPADCSGDLGQIFHTCEIEEFSNGAFSGAILEKDIYPRHPWSCASYFFAVAHGHITEDDFSLAYSGMWGVEDNDLVATLYKRGVQPISHYRLRVLHWNHAAQSDDLYDAQLQTALERHPEPYIITRDAALLYSWRRLPRDRAPRQETYPYDIHFSIPPYTYVNSSALVASSLFFASRSIAMNEGRVVPTMSPLTAIDHLLPYPEYRVDALYPINPPTANHVVVHFLISGNFTTAPDPATYAIGYVAFEGSRIDPAYYSYLNLFDALWVPSELNMQTLRAHGWAKPIGVMPHGIFSGYNFPHQYRNCTYADFRFITVGIGRRKQHYALIEQFTKAFRPHERVGLYIVDAFHSAQLQQCIRERYPEWQTLITVAEPDLSYAAVSREYVMSDAFVSVSRGEAWQMPVLEAMASGLPVIVPRDNGIPYVNETNAILTDSYPVEAPMDYGYVIPDIAATVRAMRALVNDPRPAKKRATALLDVIHTRYTWTNAARIMWQWLDEHIPYV